MSWSFRIARIFGIDLKIHFTFLLVVLWGAMGGAAAAKATGHTQAAGMLFGIVAVALLFTCVTLHELGHALVAIRFGVPVREIYLLPIGGVAMLNRSPSTARQELLIAIAGPLVNVAILIVLVPALLLAAGWGPAVGIDNIVHFIRVGRPDPDYAVSPSSLLLLILTAANVMLIAFNLIPAFPLDGGRVLRSLLWMRMPMPRATRIASSIGQVFAVLLGLYGVFGGGGLLLTVIAVFIFFGAGAESASAQAGTVLATRRVGDAYNKFALTLSLDDRVSRVIDYILTSYQPDYAVIQRGRLLGVVTREDVVKWLAQNDYDVFVTEIMHEDVLRADANSTLDEVREKMNETQQRLAAVYDADRYLGLVSAEDIAEAQIMLTFLQRGPRAGAPTTRGIRTAQAHADPSQRKEPVA